MTLLLFISGLICLILGAELLVRGSSRLAGALGITPLIIGLTVVAFGTSSPELAVSIKSALSGQGNIAVGNVVGSNIFNVLFILGAAALIIPLRVSQQLVRIDVPIMIILSIGVLLLALDGMLERIDGLLLTIGLVGYLWYLFYQNSRKETAKDAVITDPHILSEADNEAPTKWGINLLLVAAGLTLLIFGSRWLVNSAVSFAQLFGISDLIIGLTIVSAGTSLPEVVTSVIAAFRGERDIAVGNIVGSNLFNLMAVLGITSLIAPGGVEVATSAIRFDLPIMIASALVCLPIFFSAGEISRWEGGILACYYVAYTIFLILSASKHAALPAFNNWMLYFVIPLTVLTLVVVGLQEYRSNKHKAPFEKHR